MKLLIIVTIILLCQYDITAQTRPAILLEDMDEHSLDIKCYCKPGVRNKIRSKGLEINYQFLGAGEISAPNNELTQPFPEYSKFRKFKTKISLPIIRQEQFKVIIGYSYVAEQFEINDAINDYQGLIAATDDLNFKKSSFNYIMAYSPNATNYIGAKLTLSYNGSYDGLVRFSNRYAVFSGGIAYGIKKHQDNEWGFGIAGSKNFRNQGFRILPFLFWNKTLNDHWGFQILLPSSLNLRYNYSPKTILIASVSYNGDSYSFDQVQIDDRAIAFNHSEILTVAKLQQEIVPWLWLDLQAGYHYNFNSSFELQTTQEELLEIDPGNSYILKFGIFISPPDKFLDQNERLNTNL
jgi:hypothetical protein